MDTDILVIGAGPAGLAVASSLIACGREPLVIEKAEQVAASWRTHYERLHLHTVKALSALPGLPFPAAAPRYVPRQGVVDYLADYAERRGVRPRFGQDAVKVVPQGGRWRAVLADGTDITANAIVVATGANIVPFVPSFEGRDGFAGRIVHSASYRTAAPFAGERVLVVGMGNTGAEIALDLCEHGVSVALSVRSPVNIVHRDVLGRPTQRTSMLLARLPPAWGNALASWLRDLTVGDMSRHGLRTPATSPLADLREHGKTPVIDVGTLARIRAGEIRVHPGIERLLPGGARFVDGSEATFDVILAATGYRSGIAELFPDAAVSLDAGGLPRQVVGEGALAGVYFVGFDTRQPGGLLRTIGQQAVAVAASLCAARRGAPQR
ncbi:MAG: NAD(P)/FAD-dependent oxidoreductase [Caldimonas sp.]